MRFGKLPLALSLVLGALGTTTSCATGAVAVGECRQLESLRCEASAHCGTVDDVEACKRFYDDQCLHGFESRVAPTANDQKDCVDTIRAASSCAKKDPKGLASSCKGVELEPASDADAVVDVCDVIGRPWDLKVCDYVSRKSNDGSAGAGGGS